MKKEIVEFNFSKYKLNHPLPQLDLGKNEKLKKELKQIL